MGQVMTIQDISKQTAAVILEISEVIAQIKEITSTIALAIEEESIETQRISYSIEQTSLEPQESSAGFFEKKETSKQIEQIEKSAHQVLAAAHDLSEQSEILHREIDMFLRLIKK
ncbi:hypothetical protein CCP2SC5_770003 [Azospirillaceae bacterium]